MTRAAIGVRRDLRGLLGDRALASTGDECFERGQRYGAGKALCVAQPANPEQVRDTVRYCVRNGIRLVVQGANSGLVGASTPDATGEQVVLSLTRMAAVESLDRLDRAATVLAGTRLSAINAAAGLHQLFFPIDLGADPTMGGMVATNTGGARLLRYGDVQHNLLGLEVVLADADATMLCDLKGLRKDNSGIDWKQLFVGTGGSFGVITRARIELQPLPSRSLTALLVPRAHDVIPELVHHLEETVGGLLTACEGMSRNAMAAALTHHPGIRNPFACGLPDYAVLIELGLSLTVIPDVDLEMILGDALQPCLDGPSPLLSDILIGRGDGFWALRHAISDGLRREGRVVGFDIAVPRSALPAFRADALAAVGALWPEARVCDFGHCGDGGDHFNVILPFAARARDEECIEHLRDHVLGLAVDVHGGTFSAEHGVGPHNARYYQRYTASCERALATQLKSLLDPKGLLGNVSF